MFKISITDTPSQRKLVVEGKLSGPWVDELRTTWTEARAGLEGRKLVIDVSALTVISHEGECAIFDLMEQGARFSCAGILTRHVLKRLARQCHGKLRGALNRTEIETKRLRQPDHPGGEHDAGEAHCQTIAVRKQ
jgi:hypothetical protein